MLTRTVTVAGGVYAPGHLGELTPYVPFELVDDVLARTRRVQRRLRQLPSRVGVYFLLALGLFPSLGYARVWDKLTAGLQGLPLQRPSEKSLRDLRRRLGPAPMKELFEVLVGPMAQPTTPGVCYRRWRTVAFDGCSSLKAPDQPQIRGLLDKIRHHRGMAGYPALRLLALCETGTRGLLGAVFGPSATGEMAYAARLLPLLTPRTLLLADRGFDADAFLASVSDTGAQLLIRLNPRRRPAVLATLPDGSFLTRFNGLKLRIIEAHITVTTNDGKHIGDHYWLATTLLDHRTDPADALARLYHERWEVVSAFYALRHTLLTGRVLRSCDPSGLEQEVWALLTLYQVLRRAMVDATESAPGTDPDRASFTVALQAARNQLITASGVLPADEAADTTNILTNSVLTALLPKRRPRMSARRVKCPLSRYPLRPTESRPLTSQNITQLAISIHRPHDTHPPSGGAETTVRTPGTALARTGTKDRTLQLLRSDPHRTWRVREIAHALQYPNFHSLCAQLSRWTREGLLHKPDHGTYRLTASWIHHEPPAPLPLTDRAKA
ncbi:IS4 family transposase [Streptomyces sp. NBC_01431]|uniref:IS4 family transposase n=1 Tax=Streptomyces sp. NBC_01431 TaxID=2903863 RepID=UPI002E36BE77|nr:IS4 family transposase [Streptomyces sp. NBC_01431]